MAVKTFLLAIAAAICSLILQELVADMCYCVERSPLHLFPTVYRICHSVFVDDIS
jgi:hypothetical protein